MCAGAGVSFWVTASLQNFAYFFFPPSIMCMIHFQDLVNAAAGFLGSITGDATKLVIKIVLWIAS